MTQHVYLHAVTHLARGASALISVPSTERR